MRDHECRTFFSALSGSLLAAPLAAEAQPAGKVPVVALVSAASSLAEQVGRDPISPAARAFVHTLRDLGWVEGRNVVIERRSGEGQHERLPAIFADLVARNVAVIAVSGTLGQISMTQEAQRVTRSIPIVMVVGPSDPVGEGSRRASPAPAGT